ncbi:MAG: hypothetical protein BWY66_01456 [bacterium ADurb.Bin374]|nr:MAG: hypothetical protein BWY66_01456 [bacterium ADurb.Bin374]
MGRKEIAEKIAAGTVHVTRHAYEQMIARGIYIKQVHEAIVNGRVMKKWTDRGGDRLAIVGARFNGDVIKVIVKDCDVPRVITVCWPYETGE